MAIDIYSLWYILHDIYSPQLYYLEGLFYSVAFRFHFSQKGRQGKGSIFVFAAGNGGQNYDNCAYNGYANSVFTIAISGVSRNGSIPGYAERCSAIMACAFSQDNVGGRDSIVSHAAIFCSVFM